MQKKECRQKSKSKKSMLKIFIVPLAVVLFMLLTSDYAMAFLTMGTQSVKNLFTPTAVPNSVVEDFEDSKVKNNVKIHNNGNTDAYIRAAVVVNWVEDGHPNIIYGKQPVEGTDYQIAWTMEDWIKGADGFYYYIKSVAPGSDEASYTGKLFTSCTPVEGRAPQGYILSVQIIGQSIQSKGVNEDGIAPVVLAWGTDKGGSVTGIDENGKLSVATENGN